MSGADSTEEKGREIRKNVSTMDGETLELWPFSVSKAAAVSFIFFGRRVPHSSSYSSPPPNVHGWCSLREVLPPSYCNNK